MLLSSIFVERVLRVLKFTRRIIAVFVDECHCISHWGAEFRKKYASLGIVRSFLPRNTPVIAVTATLTRRVHRDIHTKLSFPPLPKYTFINAGNDRPNVFIVVRAIEHSQQSFVDLRHLEKPPQLISINVYLGWVE